MPHGQIDLGTPEARNRRTQRWALISGDRRMSRMIAFPELTGEQLVDLHRLLRSRSAPAGVQRRALLIWELAAGSS